MNKSPEYTALLFRQNPDAPPLVLLSASAIELDQWVGIPQKTRITDGETLGFQRDDNPERVEQIAQFYGEARNVIHNPLLCAIRQPEGVDVTFVPDDGPGTDVGDKPITGKLRINVRDRSADSLLELIREVRKAIEARIEGLADRPTPDALVAKLRALADLTPNTDDDQNASPDADADTTEDPAPDTGQAGEEALFEESHVTDFWDALMAREDLLVRLGDQFKGDEFLGFTRDAMEAYLKPVVLVDGQHRLLGALKAARDAVDSDPDTAGKINDLVLKGTPRDQLNHQLLVQHARRLPISLLLDHHPGEHVFQFVVVNQKATPVRPALLATIISTSLSESELTPISDRLENAGVPLKSSRAISFFARHASSPFAGRVARGLSDEGSDLLPWTVLGQLVAMFRDLKGARFYHDTKMDYADNWKRRHLERSKLVDSAQGSNAAYEAWRDPDGPWKAVFVEFWSAVRDALGNQSNPDASNYWGKPRSSNLFNKPSLATLATDFFAFLVETRQTIDSSEDVRALVNDWLVEVDKNYFARDWKLTGVKKDATGTRKQWSKIWYGYRRDPKMLPRLGDYSNLYKGN